MNDATSSEIPPPQTPPKVEKGDTLANVLRRRIADDILSDAGQQPTTSQRKVDWELTFAGNVFRILPGVGPSPDSLFYLGFLHRNV